MDWPELLKMAKGQETDYDPDKLKAEVEPIFEISENIRPRLVLMVRLPDGGDILGGVSFHREKHAFQLRIRYRDPKGKKYILRPSKWRVIDEKTHQARQITLIQKFQALAKDINGKLTKLEFGPEATDQEIIKTFTSTGVFDILTFDPKKGKAKKLA